MRERELGSWEIRDSRNEKEKTLFSERECQI